MNLSIPFKRRGISQSRHELILAADVPEGMQVNWCQLRVLPGHFAADGFAHYGSEIHPGLNR